MASFLSFSINPSPSLSSTMPIQPTTTVHTYTYEPHTAAKMKEILYRILCTAILFLAVITFMFVGITIVVCFELILELIFITMPEILGWG
jgi:hypothetical protein